ncbi:GGDEF domain-containing protein [Acinetobacter sp. ANC 4862]|nr:GGDEF domain-containing protein [Acinetobacter sp. ANC 4862]
MNCQALNIIAHPDALTGLHNRRQFTQLAEQEIQSAQKFAHPICLLMFDIDEFKKINDCYGHDIGDLVLQQIAETSSNILRANDVLARFGGEEFIMLLPRAIWNKPSKLLNVYAKPLQIVI